MTIASEIVVSFSVTIHIFIHCYARNIRLIYICLHILYIYKKQDGYMIHSIWIYKTYCIYNNNNVYRIYTFIAKQFISYIKCVCWALYIFFQASWFTSWSIMYMLISWLSFRHGVHDSNKIEKKRVICEAVWTEFRYIKMINR